MEFCDRGQADLPADTFLDSPLFSETEAELRSTEFPGFGNFLKSCLEASPRRLLEVRNQNKTGKTNAKRSAYAGPEGSHRRCVKIAQK